MSAKKMFEKEGLKLYDEGNYKNKYQRYYGDEYGNHVAFYWDKSIIVEKTYTLGLHLAINKQLEELGWL